ncbi:MAG: hypothetical protein QM642_04860 [Edaphocola sp.]
MKKLRILTTMALATILWAACNKDETKTSPEDPENEFMTTVRLVATNDADASDVQTASWVKLDPTDTAAPDLSNATLNLKANANYTLTVAFLDQSQTPEEDLTEEIWERRNYHLVCFEPAAALDVQITSTDHDDNAGQYRVGLTNALVTGAVSSGDLEVTLHHQPNVKNGDCAPGSVDADVHFTVNIQ